MVKDPFYRQIREALDRKLDGDLFEACACDLLRKRVPTLVPMTGGHDGGVDGEIADGEGEPYPLVCTTQKRVLDNLTRSLERIHQTGGRRRRVVVATSQALSPKERRDLRDRARELGFTLIRGVCEQRVMAALLYRSSRWCLDLLDLPGKPAALSVLPPSLNRPLLELELLGREKDAEWLRSTSGDRVLIGGPGVGKTYLLYRLALEDWGLFLASDGEAEISNAIRDQKPEVIVVDDAHVDPGRLERLSGLRREIGAPFSIVATTWKGRRDEVAAALNVSEARIRTLEPLPRQQIQQIFEELGVEASDEDLLELVDQACNRPGLATTLAALWLEGDWLSVLRGGTLTRDVLTGARRLVGRDEEGLLAIFGLGGRCGMPVKRVGEQLHVDVLEMRERLALLSAAGVLSEVGGDCLAVQPRALRSVLLFSVLFPQEGARLVDYRDFLDLAPGYDCSVREIVTAAALGARIPAEEMQGLLRQLDPADYPLRKEAQAAWGTFVGLGKREALWAFEHYPGELIDIAWLGLDSAAEATIHRLLERAEAEAPRRQPPYRAHPQLVILRRWLHEITIPEGETLERRRQAIRAASRYAEGTDSAGALAVAFSLGCLTLRPTLQSDCIDPTRTALRTRRGPLPPAQLRQMSGVWRDALQLFKVTGVVSFSELDSQLWEWRRLADARREEPEVERFTRQFVIGMLRDLTPLAAGRPGLSVALARRAGELGIELSLDLDPRFEILFPPNSEGMTVETLSLEALAGEWVDASPAEVVERFLHLTQEARSISTGYYNRVSDVCRMLADRAQEPRLWFEVLIEKHVPSSWLAPFLDRLSTLASFHERVGPCLQHEAYAEIGVRSVLRLLEPPPDLLEAALERASDFPSVVKGMGLRGELSTSVAEAVLTHPEPALALALAFGEWISEPEGQIRQELEELWRQAVLRSIDVESPNRVESYWLTKLLSADPELAYEWLLRLALRTSCVDLEIRSAVGSALGFLAPERKGDLLERLSADSILVDYLPQLIDHDVELYRRLLGREVLGEFRLLPLQGLPGADWAELAKLALRAGFEPEEVAGAAYSGHHTIVVWRGTGEQYWQRWAEAFASLDCPGGVASGWQEVIQHGRDHALKQIYEAEQPSRHIERDGMFMLADPG